MRFYPMRNSMFDDMFEDVFGAPFTNNGLMRTDIHEKDGQYVLDVDLPGYAKEDIKLSLYDGNLTIEAKHDSNKETKDEKGNMIRQERYSGSCSRTFYVGRHVNQEDIQASFKDGILTLNIPNQQKAIENKKYIEIQ